MCVCLHVLSFSISSISITFSVTASQTKRLERTLRFHQAQNVLVEMRLELDKGKGRAPGHTSRLELLWLKPPWLIKARASSCWWQVEEEKQETGMVTPQQQGGVGRALGQGTKAQP